jgi:large subunit ribosomal protein L9
VKVILTEEIAKLGGANEIVEVREGYARNFLLPRSLALPATKSAMANLNNLRSITEARLARQRGAAEEIGAKLAGVTVVMPAKVGTGGKLYGSISAADIAEQLQKSTGVEIDKKLVGLDDHIRAAGVYTVTINLHRDVKPQVQVQVGDAPAVAPEAGAQDAAAEVAAA